MQSESSHSPSNISQETTSLCKVWPLPTHQPITSYIFPYLLDSGPLASLHPWNTSRAVLPRGLCTHCTIFPGLLCQSHYITQPRNAIMSMVVAPPRVVHWEQLCPPSFLQVNVYSSFRAQLNMTWPEKCSLVGPGPRPPACLTAADSA